jgi:glycosyltransferase involved in cell wall biosynthesis
MKISVIGTVGLPACYGGFETLVENLVAGANKEQHITVYCSSKAYIKRLKSYNGANLTYIPLKANGAQSVVYDILSLLHVLIKKPDAVLILGVSGCIFLPIFRCFSKSRVVTNIDGLEWRRSKWGKLTKAFLRFSERLAVTFSDLIISDNQAIADYVSDEYGIQSTVIAYGGDHAISLSGSDDLTRSDFALALCRIEPENNVEMILEAFRQARHPLKFIGNWDSSDFGKKMKKKYSSFPNINILDPIYNIEELSGLRSSCSFYVHGHSAGGTNPSLVEMMHFGKSIFCYDCDYNRASTENFAEYFSESYGLVKMILGQKDCRSGQLLREIAQRRYTWDIVCRQYFDTLKVS